MYKKPILLRYCFILGLGYHIFCYCHVHAVNMIFLEINMMCPWPIMESIMYRIYCISKYTGYTETLSYSILYFAWEDQSDAAYRILHTVLINYITVLYESYSTVMQLIGQIQYSYALDWANTAHLGKYSTIMWN